MDLTVASFDDPSRFKPKHHFGAESMHRAWLNTEGLPEMRTEDYPVLVDKWIEATGEFPGERRRTHFWTASDGVELAFHETGRGQAGGPAPRAFLRRQHELDQVRPCGTDRSARFPGYHARSSRARPQRQAARAGPLSEGHSRPRSARAGGAI